MFEFHISRAARERYNVSSVLFSFNGNAVFANPAASRELAHSINQVRNAGLDPLQYDPKTQVQPAALFAMGLIDEASHALLAYYRQNVAPRLLAEALTHFGEQVGEPALDRLLLAFVTHFPGSEVYAGKLTPAAWLAGSTSGMPHREVAFEELLLLWLENRNPAFAPFRELFDDRPLAEATVYSEVTAGLPAFLATLPELGEGRGGFLSLLLAVHAADSLNDQLALLRGKWSFAVDDLIRRLLLAGDVLKEEEVALWRQYNPPSQETIARRNQFDGWGHQPAQVPEFATAMNEYEAFSQDQDWMPRTVMIAKSTYVWLNQLSRFYGREILRLNEIPDAELETLAGRGMNALWLIGVWERSRASKTIKNLCGNPDAVASAYSLYDYTIAENLGGEPAYRDLRDRCARYGIRLASDMVPNHMGIDSTWVVEHPEWFLSRRDSPYPAYSFNGPDLSGDDRVEIKIEDHYYQQTDAAVVFQRRDKWTGDTQLIYHGNDGTSFPWNDTAQLNYLSAQVREQVIQTILHVARQFPIIRFDAAMTLAKRHIQRLWFPTPGSGGSIPSRAESAMTTSEFDAAIPEEFWREVVDRVAREVPGTLLLAEAFWLMEGYFVRTLGMHRVYNSAFMVLLRDEDNINYRKVLKNTLEFDPGIMKRYVNFMSNPDERTAIDQFGNGDKFFGVATMMATLPGLPMFGHGQVEGFTEKYGMEYYRPRFDEWPEDGLVARHNREIAPLLHNRQLFAESENFLLYDLWNEQGTVEENVFAYTNQSYDHRGAHRALIVYNNSFSGARGTLHNSCAYMDKGAGELRQRSIADALALPSDANVILAYRDNATGLHHLRRSHQFHERGLQVDLRGYQYTVLLEWRELRADAHHAWDRLCDLLNGRGVEDLDRTLLALELEHVHHALREALAPAYVREFAAVAARTPSTVQESSSRTQVTTETKPAAKSAAPPTAPSVQDDVTLLPHSELLEAWIGKAGRFIELARAEYIQRIQPPPAPLAANSQPNAVTTPDTRTAADSAASGVAPHSPVSDSIESLAIAIDTAAEACNQQALTETHLREHLRALLHLPLAELQSPEPWSPQARAVVPSTSSVANSGSLWAPVIASTLLSVFGQSFAIAGPKGSTAPALQLFDEFGLRSVLADALAAVEFTGQDIWRAAARVRTALVAAHVPTVPTVPTSTSHPKPAPIEHGLPKTLWHDGDARWLLGVNEHDGTTYFNKELHEQMLWWHLLPQLLHKLADPEAPSPDPQAIATITNQVDAARASAAKAGYALKQETPFQPLLEDPTGIDYEALTDKRHNHPTPVPLTPSVVPIDQKQSPRDQPLAPGAPEPKIAEKIAALPAKSPAAKPPSKPRKK
jgi:glycosidase